MVPKEKIDEILAGYDPSKITIATLCSHSSLQIFHGARKMGFRTLGLVTKHNEKIYDAFPHAKPDEFIVYNNYEEMVERAGELVERNVVLIPHGSFVEYMGAKNFENFEVPSYGNRAVLEWESDRVLQRQWITSSPAPMPKLITDAREIKEPVMVKYHGAKGGRGFFIAKDYPDFKLGIDNSQPYTIQEYCLGTRYYLHFFYDPPKTDGYRIKPGGVVTGNTPVVIRESLRPKAFEMAENIVNRSYELFGGMWGPFCLETVVNDKLEFRVFEISTRIVAGTNPFINGSPYAEMIYPGLSTGGRMAMEIRDAIKDGRLKELLS